MLDLDVVGERCDQRQAEAGTGSVRARADARALVGHDQLELVAVRPDHDVDRAGLPVVVRVAHDVGACLGDGEAHVLDEVSGQLQRLGEGAEDVPDHRHVLGAGRKGEAHIGT